MNTAWPVLLTVAACALVCAAWHLFTCRNHRGQHANYDPNKSAAAVARSVYSQRARDSAKENEGRHYIRTAELGESLFSGDAASLISGYGVDHKRESLSGRRHIGDEEQAATLAFSIDQAGSNSGRRTSTSLHRRAERNGNVARSGTAVAPSQNEPGTTVVRGGQPMRTVAVGNLPRRIG